MNPPEGSVERVGAVANLAAHGALGAAHIEVADLRTRLADTTASLINSVHATIKVAHERDAALARLDAVRALCVEAQSAGAVAVPILTIRQALDPTEGATP